MSDRYVFEDEQPQERYVFEDEPAPKPSVWDAVKSGFKEAVSPSGLLETAKADFTIPKQVRQVAGPASVKSEMEPGMSPTTAMTLAAPTVVTRLGSIAANRVMEQPSTDPMENVKTAVKGVVGDWRKPLSMLVSPAVMEGLFGAANAVPTVYRATAAGRRAVNAADAARVGQTMEDIAPPLAGARTAEDIRAMAAGPGKASLGEAKGNVVNTIQARVGDIRVPSLGGEPMSLEAANRALSDIGKNAFSRNPLDRTVQGIDQRQLYGRVAGDIENALEQASPAAAQAWREAQSTYAGGLAMLNKVAGRPGSYRNTPEGVELNMANLQKLVAQPRMEAALRNKLGDSAYEQLVASITRGAPIGSADRMASQPLGVLETAGSWGGFAPFARLIGKVLPNASTRYVGQVPNVRPSWYTPPPAGATNVADLLAAGANR